MRADHQSYEGRKDMMNSNSQAMPAFFPGDGRLRAAELWTCFLSRTSPKWGHGLLCRRAAPAVFPRQNWVVKRMFTGTQTAGKDQGTAVDLNVEIKFSLFLLCKI